MRAKLTLFVFQIGVLLCCALPTVSQDADLVRHFDYDKQAPLGLKEIGAERRGDVAIHDIIYASPKGGVVPAYLVVPKGKGPFAGVIWGHWYWDNSLMPKPKGSFGRSRGPRSGWRGVLVDRWPRSATGTREEQGTTV